MKMKRIIAFLLCIILILTPMQSMAATDEDVESSRQEALDELDEWLTGYFTDKDNYIAAVWNEMNTEYEQAVTKIQKSESADEITKITEDTTNLLDALGEMTIRVVPKGSTVAKVRKMYANRIKNMYNNLNKELYTDYVWDSIDQAYRTSISRMKKAKKYSEIAQIYMDASNVLSSQSTKEELEYEITYNTNLLKGYLEDEVGEGVYTSTVKKKITSAISSAQKKLKKVQDVDEIDIIMEDLTTALKKYCKVGIDEYELLRMNLQVEKDEDLTIYFRYIDMSKYSTKGYDKLCSIYNEGWDSLYDAVSMKEINKIYRATIKKLDNVKTVKQEVPGEKKKAQKILRKYLNNPKYNQKKVKPLIKKGIQAVRKCKTLNSVEKTLTKWKKKAEKTAYKFRIQSTAGSGGTITKSKKVVYGESMKFVMKADKGYKVSGVWVDGTYVGVRKSYTFKNVRKKHEIKVYFKKK